MPRQLSRQLYVSQRATQAYLWALPSINTLGATSDDQLISEIQSCRVSFWVQITAPAMPGVPLQHSLQQRLGLVVAVRIYCHFCQIVIGLCRLRPSLLSVSAYW